MQFLNTTANLHKSVYKANFLCYLSVFALMDNYIGTNYHAIEDAKSIFVQGINGDFNTKYPASVVTTDKFNDLRQSHLM